MQVCSHMEKGGRASLCWALQLLTAISKPLLPCAQEGCPYHSLQASDSVTCFAHWNVRGSEVDHFCMEMLKSVWDSAWPSSFAWKDVSMSQCHQTKETWNVEPIYEGQLPRKLIEPVKDFTWVGTKPLFLKPLTFFFFKELLVTAAYPGSPDWYMLTYYCKLNFFSLNIVYLAERDRSNQKLIFLSNLIKS